MTRLVLGVIGHVDHGKTTLVHALTGQDTDRLPEEKTRGISIALGFARFDIGGDMVDLIDMPGHERFVRTMVSGATGIDAVLLVVAANEGIKPQTIEHIDIAGLLGVRRAVVAITKCDLVDDTRACAIAAEAVELLTAARLQSVPAVPIAIPPGRSDVAGIGALTQAIATLIAGQEPRSSNGTAFLPIDRAFGIAGHGPVVTGTLRGSAIATGDRLVLWPGDTAVRVRSVQVHGERVATALPGQRVAINLRGVKIGELERGMALAAPDTLALAQWMTVAIRAVDDAPPLRNGRRLRALVGTQDMEVRLRLLDRDILAPGEHGFAQLHCATPVAIPAGEHVVLRIASPAQTVAGGRILDPETHRLRRNSAIVLARLETLRDRPAAEAIAAEVRDNWQRPTTLRQLSRLSGLTTWRVGEILATLPVAVTRGGAVLPRAELARLAARIPAVLAPHHDGAALDTIRAALPGTHALVLNEAIAQAMAAGSIRKRGNTFTVLRAVDDAARARDRAQVGERIAQMLCLAGLTPPTPRELPTDAESVRAVERLLRTGVLIRAVDRAKGKEILFHRQAVSDAQTRLAPLLAREPGLLVSDIAAALGLSRKYVMPLLDHLDTIRFTRRVGDHRRLAHVDAVRQSKEASL